MGEPSEKLTPFWQIAGWSGLSVAATGCFVQLLSLDLSNDAKLTVHDGEVVQASCIHYSPAFGGILVFKAIDRFPIHALANHDHFRIVTETGRPAIEILLIDDPNEAA